MICEKKTSKFPNGRTGTEAGEAAHRYAKEEPCEACSGARNRASKLRLIEKTLTAPWRQPYVMERACDERTSKHPLGKRGTYAGSQAHARAKEEPCPECLVARREYGRKSTKRDYDKHKDRKLAYMREYREENRDKRREWEKAYRKANPEKSREASRRNEQRRKEQRLLNSPWRWPWVNERTCDQRSKSSPDGKRGTLEGYKLHLNNEDSPCQECVSAFVTSIAGKPWMQPYTASMACEIRYSYAPHGSTGWLSGYDAHVEAGEEPCEMCLARKEKERDKERKKLERRKAKPDYKERMKAYREANPEARSDARRRRKARQKSLPTEKYSEKDITRLYGTTCYLCAQPVDLALEEGPLRRNVEHLIPISHPDCPGDLLSNVRWSHEKCNLSKGARTPEEVTHLFPDMINPYKLGELTNA